MTAATTDGNGAQKAETMARALRAVHQAWLRETDELLAPVLSPQADFWKRWTAVRHLADQFLAQYHREWALLRTMRPFLAPNVAAELERNGRRVAEIQRLLDQVGRRRGTGLLVSGLAGKLLEELRRWCADLEAAARTGAAFRKFN